VLYTTTEHGARVDVTTRGLSHYFLVRDHEDEPEHEGRGPRREDERESTIRWCRLDVALAGANIRPERARMEQPIADEGATNYYLPHCPGGVLGVPSYGTVTFPEVYPGIDWVVRNTAEGGVHHDFGVRPGAGAAQIRLEYAVGGVIAVPVSHPCDPVASIGYQVSARWLAADHPDPGALRLNGLPAGTPVTGTVSDGSRIDVTVAYPDGYDPAARYELVLEADTDGDGTPETLTTAIVQSTFDSSAVTTVAPPPPATDHGMRFAVRPNPFASGASFELALAVPEHVELSVYDLNGRLVRALLRGRLAAGPQRLDWDGRDARGNASPAGVYFVRLRTRDALLERKLVRMP
jgi:flagellar hook capping protein FlgD